MTEIASAQPTPQASSEYEAVFERLMAEADATTEDLLPES